MKRPTVASGWTDAAVARALRPCLSVAATCSWFIAARVEAERGDQATIMLRGER